MKHSFPHISVSKLCNAKHTCHKWQNDNYCLSNYDCQFKPTPVLYNFMDLKETCTVQCVPLMKWSTNSQNLKIIGIWTLLYAKQQYWKLGILLHKPQHVYNDTVNESKITC